MEEEKEGQEKHRDVRAKRAKKGGAGPFRSFEEAVFRDTVKQPRTKIYSTHRSKFRLYELGRAPSSAKKEEEEENNVAGRARW